MSLLNVDSISDSAGTGPVSFPNGIVPNNNMVWVATQNGYGSGGTAIRRFSNVIANSGSAITYLDDSTNGSSFTVNEDGMYSVSYTDIFGAGGSFGISKDAADLTMDVASLPTNERLCMETVSTEISANCAAPIYLSAGAVIRPQTSSAAASSSPDRTAFIIVKMSL